MKENSGYRKPNWLKNFHFKLIGDKSFYFQNYKRIIDRNGNKTAIFQKIWKKRFKLYYFITNLMMKMNFIMTPFSLYRIFWDIGILFLSLFTFIMIPLQLALDKNFMKDIILNWNIYFGLYFLCDILIKLNTQVFHIGTLKKKRKIILKKYFKSGLLIIDLLCLIPFVKNFHNIIDLIFFLKVIIYNLINISY